MRRNLHRYYVYTVLSSLAFTWTTWFVFVDSRGGNPGWAESAFHLAILLGEVPTGVVADLLGRRRSMLIGLVLGAASFFGYGLIRDTLTACLMLGITGLSLTFISGADAALLYETAAALGGEDFARRATARASALQMMASPRRRSWPAGWLSATPQPRSSPTAPSTSWPPSWSGGCRSHPLRPRRRGALRGPGRTPSRPWLSCAGTRASWG